MPNDPGEFVLSDDLSSAELQKCLDRLRAGDQSARNELLEFACRRFVALTRRMLNNFSTLRSFEQTGDVMQTAMLRLWSALRDVHPSTVREFHGLVAVEIRRSLLDLSRKYFGRAKPAASAGQPHRELPRNSPANIKVQIGDEPGNVNVEARQSARPDEVFDFTELHQQVDSLPSDERELVNLLYYLELPHPQVAQLLEIDDSTVKRRWRRVREKSAHVVRDWRPDG